MVHLAFPSMTGQAWIEEGLATYVEPLVRARAGLAPADDIWKWLVWGLPQRPAGARRRAGSTARGPGPRPTGAARSSASTRTSRSGRRRAARSRSTTPCAAIVRAGGNVTVVVEPRQGARRGRRAPSACRSCGSSTRAWRRRRRPEDLDARLSLARRPRLEGRRRHVRRRGAARVDPPRDHDRQVAQATRQIELVRGGAAEAPLGSRRGHGRRRRAGARAVCRRRSSRAGGGAARRSRRATRSPGCAGLAAGDRAEVRVAQLEHDGPREELLALEDGGRAPGERLHLGADRLEVLEVLRVGLLAADRLALLVGIDRALVDRRRRGCAATRPSCRRRCWSTSVGRRADVDRRAMPGGAQLAGRHGPDAPERVDGKLLEEPLHALGRDDGQAVRLLPARGDLREELVRRDAGRGRQPRLLADPRLEAPRDVRRRAARPRRSR